MSVRPEWWETPLAQSFLGFTSALQDAYNVERIDQLPDDTLAAVKQMYGAILFRVEDAA